MSEPFSDDVYADTGEEPENPVDLDNTLDDRTADDVAAEGYSPPERPRGLDDPATTASGQREGESLEERLAQEQPDVVAPTGDGIGDATDTDGELLDDEVGDVRAGRLVAPDEGARSDTEKDLVAEDVGIDGGAASAEEAAMHVVQDDEVGSREVD